MLIHATAAAAVLFVSDPGTAGRFATAFRIRPLPLLLLLRWWCSLRWHWSAMFEFQAELLPGALRKWRSGSFRNRMYGIVARCRLFLHAPAFWLEIKLQLFYLLMNSQTFMDLCRDILKTKAN